MKRTQPPMTDAEREALELQAIRIRTAWISDRDSARLKARMQPRANESTYDRVCREAWERDRGINQPPKNRMPTAEEYVAEVQMHRPLGPQDVGHIAALTVETWGPNYLTKTKTQRKRLRELKRMMRYPDITGLTSGPTEEDFREFPELRNIKPASARF
jgi:hypothetical protein